MRTKRTFLRYVLKHDIHCLKFLRVEIKLHSFFVFYFYHGGRYNQLNKLVQNHILRSVYLFLHSRFYGDFRASILEQENFIFKLQTSLNV